MRLTHLEGRNTRRNLFGIHSTVLLFLAVACTDQVVFSEFSDEGTRTSKPADPTVLHRDDRVVLPRADADAPSRADAGTDAPVVVPSLVLRAGTPGGEGTLDGMGTAARFALPYSVAVDDAGNVYVADQGNNAVRKITPAGVVTTLAGTAPSSGSADGAGAAARFNGVSGIAVDSAGDVFVADTVNQTIRKIETISKITPGGVVTTLAGTAGAGGSADGTDPTTFDTHLPMRSRCLHPGQQQGRRWPSSSSSCVRRMRRCRVTSCFASSTQQMNSLRARGVMSTHAASAVGFAISAPRRSAGSSCTTPPGTRVLLMKVIRSADVLRARQFAASRR